MLERVTSQEEEPTRISPYCDNAVLFFIEELVPIDSLALLEILINGYLATLFL